MVASPPPITTAKRTSRDDPPLPTIPPFPTFAAGDCFPHFHCTPRVLRVTSPTLHSGSGALFGNDFLANLLRDLCELLRDCLRMLGLANALHSALRMLVREVHDSQQKKRMPTGDFITGLPGHKGKPVRVCLNPAGSL